MANPDDESPQGASVDLLAVTLYDDVCLIQNVALADDDAAQLDLAQALIVATIRGRSEGMTQPGTPARTNA